MNRITNDRSFRYFESEEAIDSESSIANLLETRGVKFSFPNLKNLSSSNITYTQFLACVAQRLLIKQYASQAIDLKNALCPMSRTSEVFNKNKSSFGSGLNDLFLKRSTLSVINSQSSKNKITKDDQEKAAIEFVKWNDAFWFNRLKSEEFLKALESTFSNAEVPEEIKSGNDWKILRAMYQKADSRQFIENIGLDESLFNESANNIDPKLFDGILESALEFMRLTGDVSIPSFESMSSDGELIVPTTSSFMISTLYGIEEVETRQRRYTAPLDPYNMFEIFSGTAMMPLLKMNQLVFTLYNYCKILI